MIMKMKGDDGKGWTWIGCSLYFGVIRAFGQDPIRKFACEFWRPKGLPLGANRLCRWAEPLHHLDIKGELRPPQCPGAEDCHCAFTWLHRPSQIQWGPGADKMLWFGPGNLMNQKSCEIMPHSYSREHVAGAVISLRTADMTWTQSSESSVSILSLLWASLVRLAIHPQRINRDEILVFTYACNVHIALAYVHVISHGLTHVYACAYSGSQARGVQESHVRLCFFPLVGPH